MAATTASSANDVKLNGGSASALASSTPLSILDIDPVDLRDYAGLDSHTYRAIMMKILSKIPAEHAAEDKATMLDTMSILGLPGLGIALLPW